jgi:ribonuclease HI
MKIFSRQLLLVFNIVMSSFVLIRPYRFSHTLGRRFKHVPPKEELLKAKNCWILQFDGASQGNPGIGASGAVIYHENNGKRTEIWYGYLNFPKTTVTNNYAEYSGLIFGLEHAVKLKIPELTVQGDSQIILNQMTGVYQVKSSNLIALHEKAKSLAKQFKNVTFEHIPRALNKRADELSNLGVKLSSTFETLAISQNALDLLLAGLKNECSKPVSDSNSSATEAEISPVVISSTSVSNTGSAALQSDSVPRKTIHNKDDISIRKGREVPLPFSLLPLEEKKKIISKQKKERKQVLILGIFVNLPISSLIHFVFTEFIESLGGRKAQESKVARANFAINQFCDQKVHWSLGFESY